MKSMRRTLIKLALFTGIVLVLMVCIMQTIVRPISGASETYTAIFADANGLKAGSDVRLYGVQVGKVTSMSLEKDKARVEFTVREDVTLQTTTEFAVRYQSLTGQRFLEIDQGVISGDALTSNAVIGIAQTVPSFDITTLFNGLSPVLSNFSTDQLNRFTESMLAVIQGNGAGIGPALDAIREFSAYVTDRQTLVSTIISNLGVISDHLSGKSGQLTELIAQLTEIFTGLQQNIDGLIDFAVTSPPLLKPIDQLAATLGLTPYTNPDLDNALRNAIPDFHVLTDLLGALPGLVQSLNSAIPLTTSEVQLSCSNGRREPPPGLRILLDNEGVTLCNP